MNAQDEVRLELQAAQMALRAAQTAVEAALQALGPGNVVVLDEWREARKPTLTVA